MSRSGRTNCGLSPFNSHPLIISELACGTPPSRAQTLTDLASLQPARQASAAEVLAFIDREHLFGLGCGMGADATQGVVAHDGRVFDPTQGPQGVHEGLYVCDGAAIPSAIGVSPLLTITALAERAMALAAQRLQRPLDLDRVPARPVRDAAM